MRPWVERNTQRKGGSEGNKWVVKGHSFSKHKRHCGFYFLTPFFQVHKAPSYTILAIHSSPGLYLNLKLKQIQDSPPLFPCREYDSKDSDPLQMMYWCLLLRYPGSHLFSTRILGSLLEAQSYILALAKPPNHYIYHNFVVVYNSLNTLKALATAAKYS